MAITPGIQKLWEVSHFLQNRKRYFRVINRREDLLIFWNFFWLLSRTLSRPPSTYKDSTKANTKRMKKGEQVENTNTDIKENSSYSLSSSCKFQDLCELRRKLFCSFSRQAWYTFIHCWDIQQIFSIPK